MPVLKGHPGRPGLDSFVEVVHKPLGEKGEDSFAYSFEKESVHTQAVFDGCGGAGSWQYAEYKKATGAFISAQSMAKAYLEWFNNVLPTVENEADRIRDSFHNRASQVLSDLKRSCAPMKISGTLVKSFPCTVSAALMAPGDHQLSLLALNAGDSRVYFLTPQTGLVQLTVDDSEGDPDPLESLRDSAPMSDMLNADNPFIIKHRQLVLPYPCSVLTASDGIFGYFRSPMDFEYVLLDALMRSDSFARFEEILKEAVVKVTGDDSTCIMSFYGWGSFENIRKSLYNRYKNLQAVVSSLDAAMAAGTIDDALETVWKDYRKQTLFDEMQG